MDPNRLGQNQMAQLMSLSLTKLDPTILDPTIPILLSRIRMTVDFNSFSRMA
jgi:hypothetical protein